MTRVTPNLNRLAANGLRYTNFYSSGRCCPTRASILTASTPIKRVRDVRAGRVGRLFFRGARASANSRSRTGVL